MTTYRWTVGVSQTANARSVIEIDAADPADAIAAAKHLICAKAGAVPQGEDPVCWDDRERGAKA